MKTLIKITILTSALLLIICGFMMDGYSGIPIALVGVWIIINTYIRF